MSLLAPPREMSAADLDELFASSPAGEIPAGQGTGTVIVAPGTRISRILAATTRVLLWQGKLFRPASHDLVNLISPFGKEAIRAEVRHDESWFDGRPCIVLDYSRSSRAARRVRDEIRKIGPDEYLGLVFGASRRLPVYFILSFQTTTAALRP